MEEQESIEEPSIIKSWETYKILNKIRENVQQKKKLAKEIEQQQSIDTQSNHFTIENRLMKTNEELNDILSDGKELISNVKLANERREAKRQKQEDEKRARLLADLKKESDEATIKLDAINARWLELGEIADPMELYERLQCQIERIKKLMHQKDEIIAELQDVIDQANERYNEDQIKQEADIECLIERIDEQIDVMKASYLEHLELLHQSIDGERRTFKLFHSSEWQDLYDERAEVEEKNLTETLERECKFFEEVSSVKLEHEEINRQMRIKLDRDNDLVQQKLQNVKAEIDLNTEQLNYNYYVLQKRAAENILVRNKQKNRLIKLRACIAAMRKKISDTKCTQAFEIERQTQNVLSLYTNIKGLEQKMCTFAEINDKKFHHIWELHESSANSKLESILAIDKLLHEKHLNLQWKNVNNKPNRDSRLQSIQRAIDFSRSQCYDDLNEVQEIKSHVEDVFNQQSAFSNLFHAITEKIINQKHWLLDENNREIIESIDGDDEKQLVTIDNIFAVLGINSMQNIELLKKYFLQYATCVHCSTRFCNDFETKAVRETHHSDTVAVVASNSQRKCKESQHSFTVEHHMVPIILQQFLIDTSPKSDSPICSAGSDSVELTAKSMTASRSIELKEIESFWNMYLDALPKDTELVWQALENGLSQYLNVLKKRKSLNDECEFLRQQNAELTHLLQQYSIE